MAGSPGPGECSLSGRENGGGAPFLDESKSSIFDTIIELNSDLPLPYGWEQCLNLQTGKIYYIEWMSGRKTSNDPRIFPIFGDDYYNELEDDGDSSGYESVSSSSNTSMPSNGDYKNEDEEEEVVLVSKGCKACYSYYMMPKNDTKCPKCNEEMLLFDCVGEGKSE